MVVRLVIGRIVQLLAGAAIGALIGGILTGNEAYWIALAVGVPVVLTVGGILGGSSASRRARAGTEPPRRPGIISSIPGLQVRPQSGAVLNPVSTAQPSAGVVLNGQPVAGDASASPAPASPRTGIPWWWNALSVLTLTAGAALVLLPSAQVIAWTIGDIGQGRPFDGRDMTTGLHQQEAFDAIADTIGGTDVVEITFFRDRITVSAPTVPGARTVDRFTWQNGFTTNEGPDYTQPDDLRAALFDAGGIDMSVVARVVRESIDEADLQGLDGVYPRIERGGEGDEPQIDVALTGDYFEAYFSYRVTGELISRSGSAFGD